MEVIDAFGAGRVPEASKLLFEYMAATQDEAGRGHVDKLDQLPAVLRDECVDAAFAYPPPGTVLLALLDDQPVGVVGIKALGGGQAEIKRLWVKPSARGGVGRRLMAATHQHAAANELRELVLDVMPSRQQAIRFYKRLGYVETGPYITEIAPMVFMRRSISPHDNPSATQRQAGR